MRLIIPVTSHIMKFRFTGTFTNTRASLNILSGFSKQIYRIKINKSGAGGGKQGSSWHGSQNPRAPRRALLDAGSAAGPR